MNNMNSNIDKNYLKFKKIKITLHKNIYNYIKNEYDEYSDISSLSEINDITNSVMRNIENWLEDNDIPEKYKIIIFNYIDEKKWYEIIESFKQKLIFGTSGMRGKLSVSLHENDSIKDLLSLDKFGFNSDIIRGYNSINEITIAKNIIGLIRYMKKNRMTKIVVGFDSRTLSHRFSFLTTNLFLDNDISVILFDEPNTLPELSFSVTYFNADMGIEITASHNDKRYNGYKLITKTGSPPSINLKENLTNEIFNNSNHSLYSFENIIKQDFIKYNSKKLTIIKKIDTSTKQIHSIDDLHSKYFDQLFNILLNKTIIEKYSSKINIGYSALHGTGYDLASKLFDKIGIKNIKFVSKMNLPDSTFPLFSTKQILDPSDSNTANVVVNSFIQEFGDEQFQKLDLLCYTDPDADRLGIVVPTLSDEQSLYGKWKILKANDVWTLFLWYMLDVLSKKNNSFLRDIDKSFIVKSFLTSDSLAYISKKYGLECIDGMVGFSDLTTIVMNEWSKNKTNVGMFEESCGFGIAGNSTQQLHILEKDGLLSLAFIIEILAYAKSQNTSIQDILNHIFLDPEIGFFTTTRKELPQNDVFEGIKGEIFLRKILKNIENLYERCNKQIESGNHVLICGLPITKIQKFSTGKYDDKFWKNFPDEGIKFTLDCSTNYIIIRASGTEPKLRIFVQFRDNYFDKSNLLEKKLYAENLVNKISNEIESMIN
jgi:phosphoglucomutase